MIQTSKVYFLKEGRINLLLQKEEGFFHLFLILINRLIITSWLCFED